MTARATHARTDVPADSSNPDEIQPSDFTADHVLEDVANAADLATVAQHLGGGAAAPQASTVLVDDGTGYSEWRDRETFFVQQERRTRTVNARIQAPALLDLVANPVVLLPTPDAGQFNRVVGGLALYSYGGVAFTLDGTIQIRQNQFRWADISSLLESVDSGGMDLALNLTSQGALPTILSGPLYLVGIGGTGLAGGDGQLDLWLDYMVLPLPVID
jgi:hypothetical protein